MHKVDKLREKPMTKLSRYYWTYYLALAWLVTSFGAAL
jgi:hypothetical protein